MSLADQDTLSTDLAAVRDWFEVYGALVALAIITGLMFATRILSLKQHIRADGSIVFTGNDPWYHYRAVKYTVSNYPQTIAFDVWTGFPTGVSVGQFGTLFDQILATVALIVGLGSPSDHTVRLVMVVAPAVISVLTVFPTYWVGKRISNSVWGGVAAAGFLTVMPSSFFARGIAGSADHHIFEAFLMVLAIATIVRALDVAEEDIVVYEVVKEAITTRDFSLIQKPFAWAFAAGLVLAAYLSVWSPGVLLVGIISIYFVTHVVRDHYHGAPIEPGLFVGIVSMSVAALGMAFKIRSLSFSPTGFTLLQVFVPLASALAFATFGGLSRLFERKSDYGIHAFPATILGLGIGGIVFLRLALPSAYSVIQGNLVRVFGLGVQSSNAGTIREAQTFLNSGGWQAVISQYGLLFFVGLVGMFGLVYVGYRRRDSGAALVAVWSALIGLATFTQIRFNYYLATCVAIVAAYTLSMAVSKIDLYEDFPEYGGYQYITVILILLLILPVLFFPIQSTVFGLASSGFGGAGSYTQWEGSLDWMNDNTPEEGNLEGANNSEQLEKYGKYEATDDYEYPEGSYGVMSWWDYGHWITTTSERIPVANPFQQHAPDAAEFLLAQNETEADNVMESRLDAEQQTRYVMVDWQMVRPESKFNAIATWHETSTPRDYSEPVYVQANGRYQPVTHLRSQKYFQSMMIRLYLFHGSAVGASSTVVDYDTETVRTEQGSVEVPIMPSNRTMTREFRSNSQAEEFARQDGSASVGGFGRQPPEAVDALEHYRLVHSSKSESTDSGRYRRSLRTDAQSLGVGPKTVLPSDTGWVKTFERVPGATVKGQGPANTTVRAGVQMKIGGKNRTFTYYQLTETGPNGNFTMTVPYSSTGYKKYGPEDGYTNTSVRATGKYQFIAYTTSQENNSTSYTVWQGRTAVTEGQVIGENDSPATVTLTEQDVNIEQSSSESEGGGSPAE